MPSVVTVTSTVPALRFGEIALQRLGDVQSTDTAGVPPKETVVAPTVVSNPLP
jgi:hypothetical protein